MCMNEMMCTCLSMPGSFHLLPCCSTWQDLLSYGQYAPYCICHIFLHSLVEGHLVRFHILAIMNRSAMSMGMQILLHCMHSISFGYTPWREITGCLGSSVSCCFRNLHITLHNSSVSVHFYQACMGIPFSLHPSQHIKQCKCFLLTIHRLKVQTSITVLKLVGLGLKDIA